MTNQERFKKDTEELYNKLQHYIRYNNFMDKSDGKFSRGVLTAAADRLRLGLEIARTDEENTAQYNRDGMC